MQITLFYFLPAWFYVYQNALPARQKRASKNTPGPPVNLSIAPGVKSKCTNGLRFILKDHSKQLWFHEVIFKIFVIYLICIWKLFIIYVLLYFWNYDFSFKKYFISLWVGTLTLRVPEGVCNLISKNCNLSEFLKHFLQDCLFVVGF